MLGGVISIKLGPRDRLGSPKGCQHNPLHLKDFLIINQNNNVFASIIKKTELLTVSRPVEQVLFFWGVGGRMVLGG